MNKSAKMFLGWCLVGFGAIYVAGCASIDGKKGPEVAKDSKADVSVRAQARWQALIDGNMKDAYGYISPAGRKFRSLDLYRAKIKPGLWRDAKTQSVTCSEELCEAIVLVKYDIRDIKGLEIEMKESWVKEEGNWWYVQKK